MWNDAPTSLAEDRFGRASYARIIADLIDEGHSWNGSIVFGLTGPWGSGKTSMLGMVEEALKEHNADWQIVHFTPWASGDVDGLLGDFYASLAAAMPTVRGHDRIRKALGTLAQVTAPAAKLIPWGGDAVAETASKVGQALQARPSWDQAFKKATAEFEDQRTPVLVIADDIDRLQTDELLALLKVVRLLGQFPGVYYLLAYDEETLFNTLAGTNLVRDRETAGKFMEKIVQYPLFIPPLQVSHLVQRLHRGIAEATNSTQHRFVSELDDLTPVLLELLPTPRAIERFLAQLRHRAPMYAHVYVELDVFVALTLLRLAFPALYQQLPMSHGRLVPRRRPDEHEDKELLRLGSNEITKLAEQFAPRRSQDTARRLLLYLFPIFTPPVDGVRREPVAMRLCSDGAFNECLYL